MIRRSTALLLAGGTTLWFLHRVAASRLPFPSFDAESMQGWLSTTDPGVVPITALRAVAIALCWYLIVITVAQLLVGLAGWRSKVLDRLTPAVLRQALGVTLAVASVSATVPTWSSPALAQSPEPSPPVTMVRLSDDLQPPVERPPATTDPASTGPANAESPDDRIVLTRIGPAAEQTHEAVFATTWQVTEGEHFWQIAHDTLEDRLDRAPSIPEVDDYWRSLIERNRHRLVDPTNPDLMLPGQVLDLPGE